MLPNHEGEPEQEYCLALVLFQESFYRVNIQVHLVVESIKTIRAKHRESQYASTAGREHRSILDYRKRIKDKHWHTLFAKE
jgi:hypothetical protein